MLRNYKDIARLSDNGSNSRGDNNNSNSRGDNNSNNRDGYIPELAAFCASFLLGFYHRSQHRQQQAQQQLRRCRAVLSGSMLLPQGGLLTRDLVKMNMAV
ncbi:hypothetical protein ElyMa_002873500 [Elysia marginata]|uniref:Uncharacterized protein n=1 Tax=Elysia marginata TaxID=1093978 RepID=A0AAV4HYN1_9GAST|nr:hypothetical protein ElyMa_002873500 [Elysia marginata]